MKKAISSRSSRQILLILHLLIMLPGLGFGQSPEAIEKLNTFLEVAEDLFQKAELPGAGIAIVYKGDVLYTGGFGYSNIESQAPITENSLFFIGSNTKAFTGFLAAKLVESGQLDWKTPIINYLPDFKMSEPYVARHVNLEDLFTHMTGLSRKDELWHGEPITREEVYQQVATLGFDHSFRGEWAYNNHAYVVIGKVLETIANSSWETLIEDSIFKPLGMLHSHTSHQKFMDDAHHVSGYYGDGKTEQEHISSDNVAPAGAISSTPKDIGKWLKMLVNKGSHHGKQLISPLQYDYTMGPKGMSFSDTCTVRYYSIGWGGSQSHGKRTLRHSGAIAGNSARVSLKPDDGFGIYIMTNQRSDYKAILTDYAESIFVDGGFERDFKREEKVIGLNRFVQFQNTLLDAGIEPARAYYQTLKYKDFEPSMLNLGQALLEAAYIEPALFVAELNITDHPDSYRAHDNYADALARIGDTKEAMKIYQMSLSLNPEGEYAQKQLKELLGKD